MDIDRIVKRYHYGLLKQEEAISILDRMQKRAKHDRDYSDSLSGYKRFDAMLPKIDLALTQVATS